MKKAWIKISLLGAALLLTVVGCRKGGAGSPAQGRERVVPVKVAVARVADVPLYVDCLGVCVAHDTVEVVPRVSGEIVDIHFQQGQMVKSGQLLYTIDPSTYDVGVTLALGQLQAAQAKLELDRLHLTRATELANGQYIAPHEFDALKAMVAQSEGQVQIAHGNLRQAEIYRNFCSVHSPIAGLAGYNHYAAGNVVAPGMGSLVTVQKLDPLYVDFAISENEFPKAYAHFKRQRQLACEVSLVADPRVRTKAWLAVVDNQVSLQSGNVRLRAMLDNPDFAFWPGESVRVRLILSTLKNAVLVPEVAVSTNQRGRYAFVINGENRAEMRPVTLAQAHGTDVVITSGLNAGDRVVVAGQFLLAPNTLVIPDDGLPLPVVPDGDRQKPVTLPAVVEKNSNESTATVQN
ncbi:MAG: efflux RND transporter periplasmic adaptor subunit [Puniceicoccales bacterium]|jgi:multidrug efflux system membrane fusion protein|nr:efflux RND transporter periplasmic adaptor subunit [Puniceicoccales bacterium]